LQILHYENGDSASVASLVNLLQCCPDIEIVDVGSTTERGEENSSASDAHTAAIMQHCSKLRAVCVILDNVAVLSTIVPRASDLLQLCLYNVEIATDTALTALAENCGNLRTLELWAQTRESSQAALVTLVNSLKNVVELRIVD
jgi:ferredoxin-fold anticodon binding domain-containing protein